MTRSSLVVSRRINGGWITGTNAKEDKWRVPSLADTLIEDVQHRVVFIKSNLQSGISTEGDVAQDDAQSDGHQEKWFKILLDGKPDADNSYHDHGEVSCRGIRKARIGQELIEVLYDEIHKLSI